VSEGFRQYLYQYIPDHSAYVGSAWNEAAAGRSGALYPFIMIGGPNKDDFIRRVKAELEQHASRNPLDGREHDLAEMARWAPLGSGELALRFIVIGQGLGIFRVVPETWNPPPRPLEMSVGQWIAAAVPQNACRFHCTAAEEWETRR
jgi:hypothetical protein